MYSDKESSLTFFDKWSNIFNFTISLSTAVGATLVVIIYGYWWWSLRDTSTTLRPLFLSIIVAKFFWGWWAWKWSFFMLMYGREQDFSFILERLGFLTAILIQLWIGTLIEPAPKDSNLGCRLKSGKKEEQKQEQKQRRPPRKTG